MEGGQESSSGDGQALGDLHGEQGSLGIRGHSPHSPSSWPQDSGLLDQSAKYYHLTHDELIGLLLQRERELSQREEHVQELESYIDRLLVRIMETSPTLLQIPPESPK